MRRALRVFAAAALLLPALAACSLLVDTSQLSGADVAASPDAATTPADGAADTSNATDAPAGDARVGEAGDAGTDVDSSVAPCIPNATRLCDAFDDPAPGSTWTSKDLDRGTVTFDAVGLSLPHALHAKIVAGTGNGDANLVETYPTTRTNVRCDFDLKLVDVPTSGELDVINVTTTLPSGQSYEVYFAIIENAWAVAEYQSSTSVGGTINRQQNLPATLPKNTWFHVAFAQAGATATVTANGVVATLGALAMPAGSDSSVNVGITYVPASVQSGDVIIDNVDCTVLP